MFDDVERHAILDLIAANPEAGAMIEGTGGVRKVRVPAQGGGKSGGARVIYYFYNDAHPIFALLVYGKGSKTNLSADEKKAVAGFVRKLKAVLGRAKA